MACVLGGIVASAAYKKWEKAAMAGVSLVADAAEELERSTVDPNMMCNVDARTFTSSSNNLSAADGNVPFAICHILTFFSFVSFFMVI
jgi:hypothetical protein